MIEITEKDNLPEAEIAVSCTESDLVQDNRKKLEADIVYKCAQPGFGPEFQEIMQWLDRQAAITEREYLADINAIVKKWAVADEKLSNLIHSLKTEGVIALYNDGEWKIVNESAEAARKDIAELQAEIVNLEYQLEETEAERSKWYCRAFKEEKERVDYWNAWMAEGKKCEDAERRNKELQDKCDGEYKRGYEDGLKANTKAAFSAAKEAFGHSTMSDDQSTKPISFSEDLTVGQPVFTDSRYQLEKDIHQWLGSWTAFSVPLKTVEDAVHDWLNRQAAITANTNKTLIEWQAATVARLQAEVDQLRQERDNLADDLLSCTKEREAYRELFGKSLDFADEIISLGAELD